MIQNPIPLQLQKPEFRFYLVGKNEKLPIEKSWNDQNCYPFNHIKLQLWLVNEGNYGIVTGYGGLLVLDFDDREFYESIKDRLPETFTVLSATKRLPHLYYVLEGEMFKKLSIRNGEDKTLCDIQAYHCGIVAPGSCVNRRYYAVERDIPITVIYPPRLDVLPFKKEKQFKKPNEYAASLPEDNEEVQKAILTLLDNDIERRGARIFKCPFHEMQGRGNLSIMPNGWLYCFHTQTTWHGIGDFMVDYHNFKSTSVELT